MGVTKASFENFSVGKIFRLAKVPLSYLNHIYIWQVPPQLSCSDTCQIKSRYSIANVCFHNTEKFINSGTEEIGLVTPTPRSNKRRAWFKACRRDRQQLTIYCFHVYLHAAIFLVGVQERYPGGKQHVFVDVHIHVGIVWAKDKDTVKSLIYDAPNPNT